MPAKDCQVFRFLGKRQWHPTPVLLPGKSYGWGSLVASVHGVAKSRTRLSDFTFTFHFHASEKEMATHSSVLAWRIPWMGEPGGLPSMGSHRVRHDWSDLAAAVATDFYVNSSNFKHLQVIKKKKKLSVYLCHNQKREKKKNSTCSQACGGLWLPVWDLCTSYYKPMM